MHSLTCHPRRSPTGALIVVLAALLVASAAPAGAQTADDLAEEIEATRSDAAELAAEIEEIGQRASVVLEEFRQAQDALAEADDALFDARRRVAAIEDRVDQLSDDMQDRLVAIYQGGGAPSPMTYLDANSAVELGSRRHYADTVAAADRAVIDRLESEQVRLAEERERLEEQREEQASRATELDGRREAVESAMAEREEALALAEGELADLVAEEQERRAAEAAARAREEARRRAEEEARLRAATSTTSVTPTTVAAPELPDPPDVDPPAENAPQDLPPVHPRAGEAVQAAISKIGTPYRWGGNGPDAYDCSGLTSYAWASVGVSIPRSSALQKAGLPPVPIEHIQPGDLLFYGNPVHHVGIYAGDGQMVNAPYTGTTVRMNSIWRDDFAGAGRPG